MKLLEGMDLEEICALSEEQLDRRVRIECAEQGIPLPTEPPTIEAFDLTKSVVGYKVSGCEYIFRDPEQAKKLLTLLEGMQAFIYKEGYDYRLGYDIRWIEKHEPALSVETLMYYEAALVREKESFIIKRKTLKEDFDKQKASHDESRAKYRKIADYIYSEFYAARRKQEAIVMAKKTYSDYVLLADGNEEKARLFFDKAFLSKLDPEIYEAVFFKKIAEMQE